MINKIDPYKKVSLYHVQLPLGILYDKNMKLSERLIFSSIYTMINQGKVFWASNRTIATNMGVSKRTVSRDINDLFHKNLLVEHYNVVRQYNGAYQQVREITEINYHKLKTLGQQTLDQSNVKRHRQNVHGYRQNVTPGVDSRVHTPSHKLSSPSRQNVTTNKDQRSRSEIRISNKDHHPTTKKKFSKDSDTNLRLKRSNLSNKDLNIKIKKKPKENNYPRDFDDPFYNPEFRNFDEHSTANIKSLARDLIHRQHIQPSHYFYKCINSWRKYSVEDIRYVLKHVFTEKHLIGKTAIREIGIELNNSYQVYEKRVACVYDEIIKYTIADKSEYRNYNMPIDDTFIKNSSKLGWKVAEIISKHHDFDDIKKTLSSTEIFHVSGFKRIIKKVFKACPPISLYELSKRPLPTLR